MRQNDQDKRAEAIEWVIRLRDPARADWEGFTAWLESDPSHNAAYEHVALTDREIEKAAVIDPVAPRPSNDNQPCGVVERRRVRWFTVTAATAVAGAGLMAIALYPVMIPAAGSAYAIETRVGEHRTVKLDDGTQIELNGGTRVSLRKGNPRFASLDHGEAAFTVVHDPADPFIVEIGNAHLQDVGTTFNVLRTSDRVEASVSKGTVLYNPGAEALRLDAGKQLRVTARGDVAVSEVDPATIAGWRENRLTYRHASLATVAADLSRNLGVPISVAPEIAGRSVSGVIYLDRDEAAVLPRVGALFDVDVTSTGRAWRLTAKPRNARQS
ncbi:FecR family protein [Sphingomonas sp. YR710]|uniref:FecR family protein n=1 Tax=Sphingomonas sp. YR710 TaxID=1882773 RepID=UPI00088C92C7|nr:FecR domain-containing protein [Sphingomonas sp. YR710]SDD17973.1 FecR family protein [Sphingomonas sp. YR710]